MAIRPRHLLASWSLLGGGRLSQVKFMSEVRCITWNSPKELHRASSSTYHSRLLCNSAFNILVGRGVASSSTREEWMAAAALHDDGSLEWNGRLSLEQVGLGSLWTVRCHGMIPSDAKYERGESRDGMFEYSTQWDREFRKGEEIWGVMVKSLNVK